MKSDNCIGLLNTHISVKYPTGFYYLKPLKRAKECYGGEIKMDLTAYKYL
jgi:hypothetical protein